MDGCQMTELKMANCSLFRTLLVVTNKDGRQGYSIVGLLANYWAKNENSYSYVDIALRELSFTEVDID